MTSSCLKMALVYLEEYRWAALALCPPDHYGVGPYHRRNCTSPGKRPLGKWATWQEELPRPDDLRRQWGQVPQANVGIVLGQVSGLVGIDLDGDGSDDLLKEVSEGDVPATLAFSTSRGSRLLYAVPPEVKINTWTIRRRGCEVKVLAQGSITVMPPSRHMSGRKYRWLRFRGPGWVKPAAAPTWVWRRGPTATGNGTEGEPILEGGRNDRLFRIGCAMRRQGCTREEIIHALRYINDRRCVPPLDPTEVELIGHSINRYRLGSGRGSLGNE